MRLKVAVIFVLLYNLPLRAMELIVPDNSSATVESFDFPALPLDVQRIIQMMALHNIPQYNFDESLKNLSAYTLTSKSFHAFANKPLNTKMLLAQMGRRISCKDEVGIAMGLKNMPGVQSKEVRDWIVMRKQQMPLEQELLRCDNISDLEALVVRGVDINAHSRIFGHTLFMKAVGIFQDVDAQYLQKLITLGANVHIPGKDGETPLMRAIGNNSSVVVQELLKLGVNVNQKDRNGNTAVMKLILGDDLTIDSVNILRMIMEKKPNLGLRNKEGKTALDIAGETIFWLKKMGIPYGYHEACVRVMQDALKEHRTP